MVSQNVERRVVLEVLPSTAAKAAELLTAPPLSPSVPAVNQGPSKTQQRRGFSQLQHTGPTSIHRCQSTNTLLCCCEQRIQDRPLDCRLQRFHAWVGRLGAQVQGTFFRFVWMV